MQLVNVTTSAELEPHILPWTDLVLDLGLPISFSPEWLLAWLHAYRSVEVELNITFVYEEETLIGVLPLMVRIEGGQRTLKFLSDSCSDYLGFPFLPSAADIVTTALEEALHHINYTHFDFGCLHQGTNSLQILIDALSNHGVAPHVHLADRSLSAGLDENYQRRFALLLTHRQWRRKMAKIQELGSVEFHVVQGLAEDLLSEIRALHISKWEANKILPQFMDKRRLDFIRGLTEHPSFAERIKLATLRREGKLIAYRLGFAHNHVYYDWNTSFDHYLESYAPGSVLLVHLIQYLIVNGYSKLDFMNGNEKYKHVWATRVVNVYRIAGSRQGRKSDQLAPKDTLKLTRIGTVSCLILDIDGVVARGNTPISTTVEGIRCLQEIGIRFGFLTNTSAVAVDEVRDFLVAQGIHVQTEEVMTGALAVATYLAQAGMTRCMVIGGEPELPRLLAEGGIEVTQHPSVEAVVVGFAKEVRYDQICTAYEAIESGAAFICTDADQFYAAAPGKMPGSAWVSAALSAVCNREPIIVGKPGKFALQLLLRHMNVESSDCMLVGDSLQSDIAGGKNAGLLTCLHLGGVTSLDEIITARSGQRPDFVVASFADIVSAYGRAKNTQTLTFVT